MRARPGAEHAESETAERLPRRHAIKELWRDHLRPLWDEFEWIFVGGLAAAAFVLGYFGFEDQPAAAGETPSALDHLYHSIQLFWLEYASVSEPTGWELDAARLLAPAVLAYAAGRALVAIFREQLRLLWPTRKKRVVICGLGRMGWLLAQSFQAREHWVAVIERNEQNDWIEACRDEGIPVVVGDATDVTRLLRARVQKATYLIAVCGQDGTNADVAAHARELVSDERDRKDVLTAFAHVVDLELCRLLRDRLAAAGRRESFRLEPFNVFESGARAWLNEHPPWEGTGGERLGRPHLVVVGAGQMGKGLVVGAARKWLTLRGDSGPLPRITIVDREAHRRRDALRVSYPQLEQVCELVPVETDVTWPQFEEASFLFDAQGAPDATTIYVCLDDDARGVAAALRLLERVRDHGVPIVVRTAEAAGLAAVLGSEGSDEDAFEPLRAFPLLDRTCTPELLLGVTPNEILARAIHEEYVRNQEEAGETPETNPSMVSWHDLSEDPKESNRRQADHIAVKLQAVNRASAPLSHGEVEPIEFAPDEIELLAKLEHDRWMAERLFDGWAYAPPPKDIEKKTSPDLVPWDDLPGGEKEKDRDTARHLPVLLAAAGFRIYRLESSYSKR